MSNELVHIQAPGALAALESNLDAVNEAVSANISGGGISDFDLPRVKVGSGGVLRWIVPTLDGEDTLPRIDGVIVYARDTRVYYKVPFAKRKEKTPPDCSSIDGITGKGKPGGDCSRCPLAEFGSAEEGAGQACKQVKQLFVLRDSLLLPEVVSLPPTSLKGARQFFLRLTTQGIPYYHALISLELEKAQNANGMDYGRAVLKFIRRLTPDEAVRATQYHQLCRTFAERVPTDLEAEVREPASSQQSTQQQPAPESDGPNF